MGRIPIVLNNAMHINHPIWLFLAAFQSPISFQIPSQMATITMIAIKSPLSRQQLFKSHILIIFKFLLKNKEKYKKIVVL